jgi:hypothetical protein
MEANDKKSDANNLFLIIASLILANRKKDFNDVDLYNSILRLIHFHANDKINLEKIEEVVEWLDREEKSGTDPRIQYRKENVMKNTGEDYFEGLVMIIVPLSHWEGIIKK